MKSKPSVCPVCGGRLFLESSKGKQCAACGHVLGEEKASSRSFETPAPSQSQGDSAPTATCPNCGSVASFSFHDESGDFYSCRMCGATFQKQEKPNREQAPTRQQQQKLLPHQMQELQKKKAHRQLNFSLVFLRQKTMQSFYKKNLQTKALKLI